jgi:hypothetical protein
MAQESSESQSIGTVDAVRGKGSDGSPKMNGCQPMPKRENWLMTEFKSPIARKAIAVEFMAQV